MGTAQTHSNARARFDCCEILHRPDTLLAGHDSGSCLADGFPPPDRDLAHVRIPLRVVPTRAINSELNPGAVASVVANARDHGGLYCGRQPGYKQTVGHYYRVGWEPGPSYQHVHYLFFQKAVPT